MMMMVVSERLHSEEVELLAEASVPSSEEPFVCSPPFFSSAPLINLRWLPYPSHLSFSSWSKKLNRDVQTCTFKRKKITAKCCTDMTVSSNTFFFITFFILSV